MNTEALRKLYKDFKLAEDDVFVIKFGAKKIPMITRSGIEKIQYKSQIDVTFELVYHSEDLKTAVIKAVGRGIGEPLKGGSKSIETFGEVSPSNCKQSYPIAIAEKRALSRVVLKLAGLYQHGAFGEDEIEHKHSDREKFE